MAKLIGVQRRLLLFIVTILFTFIIRLLFLSFGSIHSKASNRVTISDRGKFKQVAFRFTKRSLNGSLRLPITLSSSNESDGTPYMVRVANFHPFLRVENLGLFAASGSIAGSLATNRGYEEMFQCDGDGDDGDGDGSDCDFGDGCCPYSCE